MKRFARPFISASACVAALVLGACAGTGTVTPAIQGAVPNAAPFASGIAAVRPKASPAKLNFTTKPIIKLTVSESKYAGKFTLKVSTGGVVKISAKTAKGPKSKVTITAVKAGQASITIADDKGAKTVVPVSVTQGVIVIQ